MTEKKRVEVVRADKYVEVVATSAVVASTPEGFFLLDFLTPDARLFAEEEEKEGERVSKIVGLRGAMKDCVRIYMTPIVAKRLLNALKERIEVFEKEFGEIRGSNL